MQNRRRSYFLLGIIIFLVVGALEASIVVDGFEGTDDTLDIFILRLGDSREGIRQEAIAAIKRLAVADDKIVLAWANLARLLLKGRVMVEGSNQLSHWEQATDAVFGLIDVDKALAGLLHLSESGNRDESILAQYAIKEITNRLKNATLEPLPGTVPHFEGTGETLDSFILRLGSEHKGIHQGAVAAIERLDVPDERIVLAWALEYVPDASDPPANTFSCITYGKVPPGYKEESPALPLTPERLYCVMIWNEDASHPTEMYFITRLDPMGRPVKLEYTPAYTNSLNVQVITR